MARNTTLAMILRRRRRLRRFSSTIAPASIRADYGVRSSRSVISITRYSASTICASVSRRCCSLTRQPPYPGRYHQPCDQTKTQQASKQESTDHDGEREQADPEDEPRRSEQTHSAVAGLYNEYCASGYSSRLLKNPQAAQYCVKNRLEMLMYWCVHSAFSPILALSCARRKCPWGALT